MPERMLMLLFKGISFNSKYSIMSGGYTMAQYNIPDYDQLKSYRIWDAHYHGFGVSEKRAATNKKMLEIFYSILMLYKI